MGFSMGFYGDLFMGIYEGFIRIFKDYADHMGVS